MISSEKDIISFIRGLAGEGDNKVLTGIGDDCAVIRQDEETAWLLTTDTLVEEVHFDLSWHPSFLLGRKTAAVNISDIAAMGGKPLYALLNIAITDDFKTARLEEFMGGFTEILQEYEVGLIGGDTVKSKAMSMFSVTVIGQAARDRILYRSGARPGDLIWVSGSLGEAAAGLDLCQQGFTGQAGQAGKWAPLINAHLDPKPLVELGRLLAESGLVRAMMDISDGLATDLSNLCRESRVGARIYRERLPGSGLLQEAAVQLNSSEIDWLVKGGEDYQLLFCSAPENAGALVKIAGNLYCIGEITGDEGVLLCSKDKGREEIIEISDKGYDHFA